MQQHVDRRAAKRTAASLVVHFVGTQLAEALMTVRHQRDACIMRCHETHLAEVNSCVSWYGRWRTGVVTGVIIILMLCIVIRGGPRCRHRRPRLNGSHFSLNIFSEPTASLTAPRNCSRVYAWLSNLCKRIFMCLSFLRLRRFLARLMARPRVTLLASDTLSMVSSNVNRPTRLWVAFGKN